MIRPLKESWLQTRRLFVVLLALGLFTMAVRNITDPDVWWHLRTGELILQTHSIPHADPYSFTRQGQPWLDHEWLTQMLIYGLYHLAGWAGLMIAFAAVVAASFFIVFLRCEGRPYIAGLMTAWGALASIPCWGVRPQVLTVLLASILLLILERSYKQPRLLWWIPPLLLLWVNLHAGYALGLGLLCLFLLGDALDRAFYGDAPPRLRLRRLILVTVVSFALVPLNPYGLKMYLYPWQTLHSRAMQAYIGEWFSPDFHQGRYLATLFMILTALLLPAVSPKRPNAREILLLVCTTFLALRSVRHIPIFVLVAVPMLSAMLQGVLEHAGKVRLFDGQAGSPRRLKLVFNAVIFVCFVVFSGARLRTVIAGQRSAEAQEYPQAAADFLAKARPPGRLLNHYNWGGYLIWKLYPAEKVYIDGRADLYGDAFLDAFASTYFLRGRNWHDPLVEWDVRTVMLPPDAPLVVALKTQSEWKSAFSDRQAVVLIKVR